MPRLRQRGGARIDPDLHEICLPDTAAADVQEMADADNGPLLKKVVGLLQRIDGTATRMTPENLGMVFAPIFIHREDPQLAMKHAKDDGVFVRLLLEHVPPGLQPPPPPPPPPKTAAAAAAAPQEAPAEGGADPFSEAMKIIGDSKNLPPPEKRAGYARGIALLEDALAQGKILAAAVDTTKARYALPRSR